MRLHDWPSRLSRTIEASFDKPFVYGEHDCGLFCADCIEAVTGVDPAAGWRGRYGNEIEAFKVMKVRSLAGVLDRLFEPVPLAFAQRGDVCIAPIGVLRNRRREILMMVVDGGVLRGAAGMIAPRAAASKAWRVE